MDNIQGKEYWETRSLTDLKMDWNANAKDWVTDYKNSADHPHRTAIVNILSYLKPKSLFEIGANCGPNLARIHEAFPAMKLSGVDASPLAVDQAFADGFSVIQGDLLRIPFHNTVDCVLADAVLLYVEPKDIKRAFDEITRIVQKYIILVEWDDESLLGTVHSWHWARNYKTILEWYGFIVEVKDITEDIWPTATWQKYGKIYVAAKNTN